MEEWAERGWIKTSTGAEDAVWFLAMYNGLGMRRTPVRSHLTWPGAVESACSALRRCPEAIATKNTVLIVKSLSEASARGSKSGLASASSTAGRLHEGSSFRARGRFKKRAGTRLPKHGAVDTQVPSSKPLWIAAMAERYPRIVEINRPC